MISTDTVNEAKKKQKKKNIKNKTKENKTKNSQKQTNRKEKRKKSNQKNKKRKKNQVVIANDLKTNKMVKEIKKKNPLRFNKILASNIPELSALLFHFLLKNH